MVFVNCSSDKRAVLKTMGQQMCTAFVHLFHAVQKKKRKLALSHKEICHFHFKQAFNNDLYSASLQKRALKKKKKTSAFRILHFANQWLMWESSEYGQGEAKGFATLAWRSDA